MIVVEISDEFMRGQHVVYLMTSDNENCVYKVQFIGKSVVLLLSLGGVYLYLHN